MNTLTPPINGCWCVRRMNGENECISFGARSFQLWRLRLLDARERSVESTLMSLAAIQPGQLKPLRFHFCRASFCGNARSFYRSLTVWLADGHNGVMNGGLAQANLKRSPERQSPAFTCESKVILRLELTEVFKVPISGKPQMMEYHRFDGLDLIRKCRCPEIYVVKSSILVRSFQETSCQVVIRNREKESCGVRRRLIEFWVRWWISSQE